MAGSQNGDIETETIVWSATFEKINDKSQVHDISEFGGQFIQANQIYKVICLTE